MGLYCSSFGRFRVWGFRALGFEGLGPYWSGLLSSSYNQENRIRMFRNRVKHHEPQTCLDPPIFLLVACWGQFKIDHFFNPYWGFSIIKM